MGLYNNRIVVKVGTSTLTNDAGKSDLRATDIVAVLIIPAQRRLDIRQVMLFSSKRA